MKFIYKWKGKLGIALCGGAAHGLAHIGILQVLEEHSVDIDIVAGTSAGSIVGALWSAGYNANELYEIAKKVNKKDFLKMNLPKDGLFATDGIQKFIKKYIPHNKFSALKKRFGCNATELITGKQKFFTTGELSKAIAASCAVPVVYKPVVIDGIEYIDGGFSENNPVTLARKLGANTVIGTSLSEYFNKSNDFNNIFKIAMQTIHILSNNEIYKNCMDNGDIFLTPEISVVDYDNLDRLDELVELGRKAAEKEIDNITGKFFIRRK